LRFSDSGLYTCQARSSSGQAVWSASLTVEDPNNPDVQVIFIQLSKFHTEKIETVLLIFLVQVNALFLTIPSKSKHANFGKCNKVYISFQFSFFPVQKIHEIVLNIQAHQ